VFFFFFADNLYYALNCHIDYIYMQSKQASGSEPPGLYTEHVDTFSDFG